MIRQTALLLLLLIPMGTIAQVTKPWYLNGSFHCSYYADFIKEPETVVSLELSSYRFNPKLDSCFGKAYELRSLEYYFSGLKKLPTSILELPKLDTLKISVGKVDPKRDFKHLSDLKYLHLSDVNIRTLPPELGQLVHLRHLEILSSNYLKRDKDEGLEKLDSLRYLSVFLREWPEEWQKVFKNLDFLELGVKRKETIRLEDLKDSQGLKSLMLNAIIDEEVINHLSQIPNLKALRLENQKGPNQDLPMEKLNFLELIYVGDVSDSEYMSLKKVMPNTMILKHDNYVLFQHFYLYPNIPLKESVFLNQSGTMKYE